MGEDGMHNANLRCQLRDHQSHPPVISKETKAQGGQGMVQLGFLFPYAPSTSQLLPALPK